MAASSGATVRCQADSVSRYRLRNTMLAIEVPNISSSTPTAAMNDSQVNRAATGSCFFITKMSTRMRARTVWVIEPTTGAFVRVEVTDIIRGSTLSRPPANRYRATVLWNDNIAAKTLVISSTLAISATVEPKWASISMNTTPGPFCWLWPTTSWGPRPTLIAQADKV